LGEEELTSTVWMGRSWFLFFVAGEFAPGLAVVGAGAAVAEGVAAHVVVLGDGVVDCRDFCIIG